MDIDNLPESVVSDLIRELGFYEVDDNGDKFNEQVGYFDEDRIKPYERAIAIIPVGESNDNGGLHESYTILIAVISKMDINDRVYNRAKAFDIRNALRDKYTFKNIFSVELVSLSNPVTLETGRSVVEIVFNIRSNVCYN